MSNDKCEELKIPELVIAAENRGIIILPEMDKDERMFKFTKLCDYPNVSVFLIGEKDRERIVIKSGRHGDKEVDIDSLVKISKESLDLKHYDECIKANLELLKHCRFSLETYIRLGICYYYLGEYDLAIDYLTIPTETCKKENLPACYDFSNLIKSIEKLQEDEKGLTR